ncbi:hypothetical protein GALMADRAFT_1142028 [Galerina marginata CBS 339.88]|uniref:Uncharacterized protein n=1 Tax=Galerina marginata (strain CBS 339.88) TaxID=685588 RepID=A0A067S9Q9_GALM3|nr:hypothetical protein GALMADRAFT_1142028 [Galerina marginata CBS 339.88]
MSSNTGKSSVVSAAKWDFKAAAPPQLMISLTDSTYLACFEGCCRCVRASVDALWPQLINVDWLFMRVLLGLLVLAPYNLLSSSNHISYRRQIVIIFVGYGPT